MLSDVIDIPLIALHSTHTALQLEPPQSLLLPCRRNISFPANSYPLKRRKFHFLFSDVSVAFLVLLCSFFLLYGIVARKSHKGKFNLKGVIGE